jgi:integrase
MGTVQAFSMQRVVEKSKSESSWVERFIEDRRLRNASPKTLRQYRWLLEGGFKGILGVDLDACTWEQLRAGLDKIHSRSKVSTYEGYCRMARMCLNFLGRKELAEKVPHVKLPDPKDAISKKLIPKEDRQKLIAHAPTLQDRTMFELLDELGPRKTEIANLQIRHVQFDQYGAILTLTGKTGTRRRRVYGAVPDLRALINNHPHRDDPEAFLFLTEVGTPMNKNDAHILYNRIRKLGEKILGRSIHPHQFRHTKATEDSSLFTDREMMMLYGWSTPAMVSVYSHLSMRDVEEKDLVLHGMKKKEEVMRPISQIITCEACSHENAPVAIYCAECGNVLGNQKLPADIVDQLVKSKSFREALKKALDEH